MGRNILYIDPEEFGDTPHEEHTRMSDSPDARVTLLSAKLECLQQLTALFKALTKFAVVATRELESDQGPADKRLKDLTK